MTSVFYPLANLIISSLVFIETCISKIDLKNSIKFAVFFFFVILKNTLQFENSFHRMK